MYTYIQKTHRHCKVLLVKAKTNSLFYFLTSYTNNSHVVTYTYSIYIICTHIHTYTVCMVMCVEDGIRTSIYGCEKDRMYLIPQIAKHRKLSCMYVCMYVCTYIGMKDTIW
jgi:hypothetical protein